MSIIEKAILADCDLLNKYYALKHQAATAILVEKYQEQNDCSSEFVEKVLGKV